MMMESESTMADDFWTFAISDAGELHVWAGGEEMPEANNVVRVPVRVDGDFVRISADDLEPLRRLIGTEAREILVPTGPNTADELEDLLTKIHLIAQRRIDELRGDDDEGPATPGMK
jgi:hypothetical protein